MENEIIIPEIPELVFEEEKHIYMLNGLEIPSVTRIMEPLSQHEYGAIDKWVLEKAANRGTAVHNSIENWIKFGFCDIDPEFRGYVDGFLNWWDIQKPVVVGSEIRTYHKLMRYGGTIDLLVRINGELCMLDYKTTSRVVEKNCRVQLEAYSKALESHGVIVQKKMILHLQKDGRWKIHEFEGKDNMAWAVFGSLKSVYDFLAA